ncbi:hypothetical protein Back2_28370 [Nocardioides baekrokdamisoli]|uniref:Type IV secretion protein Rhs n=1 Tax=Nocardioides baekrokdamisoli TaxID=1804624 RepID=A0A3G9IHS1_9ACTN|nr:RHS repeat-associated core domain-containing protein [Nocardioides baekrokdamisoli]BBH18550.1 hypothetical protein Back2_28370 [Nocardioides baekrokdamisoli]
MPYVPASSGSQRILDTHAGTGTCTPSCATLTDGTPEYVKATGTAVPADATAVVLSATVTTPSAGGSLSIWPQGQLGSANTSLNYLSGMTTTGTVLTSLGGGTIGTELHGATADLALDVQGYYLAAPVTTTYTYNGDNQLTDTTTSSATTNPHYTYDPHTGLAQRINDHTSDYIYGPDGALLETTADTANAPGTVTNYYLTDTLTSVRAQISTDGTLNTTNTYTPWGTGGPAYAGGYTDPTTGYNYLLNRYQDPTTGQFATVDPLVGLTAQPYGYADGNPTGETDPTGLSCSLNPFSGDNCIGAAFVAVGGVVDNTLGWAADHPVQAVGIGLGAVSLATGVGELAGATLVLGDLVIGPTALGVVSFGTGVVGTVLDAKDCHNEGGAACAGLALSLPGAISGIGGLLPAGLLPESLLSLLDYIGFGTGALGFGWDTGAILFGTDASSSEGCR